MDHSVVEIFRDELLLEILDKETHDKNNNQTMKVKKNMQVIKWW